MNWTDLACFIPLAILCNTLLPIPFDPVLIFFSTRQTPAAACALALIGSICAGVAAAADLTLFRHLHHKTPERWLRFLPFWHGYRVYLLAFVFALLPLPFSVVRLAVLRDPPKAVPYQITVALGRLPRYLLTIVLWPVLNLPAGTAAVLLALGFSYASLQVWKGWRASRD
jgi:membrane protein YqaA with SNARE-associated domain